MNIATVDMTVPNAAEAFVDSLQQTGFAILGRSTLDAALIQSVQAAWQPFFAATRAHKAAYRHDSPGQAPLCGYWSTAESETAVGASAPDIKEFFHVLPGARLPAGTEAVTMAYRERALGLGRMLLAWIGAGAFAERLSGNDSVLRVVYYPPLEGDEPAGAVRAAAHEDINLLTVLPVADAPGLEVVARDGAWHAVAGRPGDIVVNAGDMLAESTAGRFPSTTHRVVNPAEPGSARLAMPLFLTPALDTVLSARYTAGAYLDERLLAISGGNQRRPDRGN